MALIPGTEGDDSLVGTDEPDTLRGEGGDDTLTGGAGRDTLEGGLGDDVYVLEDRDAGDRDVVTELDGAGIDTVVWTGVGGYTLDANVENFVAGSRFSSPANGNGLANDMTGWAGESNYLRGEGGADTLRGGAWDDSLAGGSGADLLIGNGTATDLGTVDEDTLDGGSGADTMIGGLSIDTYWVDDLGDVVIEAAAPTNLGETEAFYLYHWDSIYWTGAGRYQLAENVEFLHLREGGLSADGNGQSNVIYSDYGSWSVVLGEAGEGDVDVDGGGGDDTVLGGTGLDTLNGGADDDRIDGNSGDDTLRGGAGSDDIYGDSQSFFAIHDDLLFGDDGDDRLDGQFGDDVLDGGAGSDDLFGDYGDDTLTGGAGADRFAGGPGQNVVTDFTDGEDLLLAGRNLNGVTWSQDGTDTVVRYGNDDYVVRLLNTSADSISEADFLFLLAGDDTDNELSGGGQGDFVEGGAGDDTLNGGGGADDVDGGVGDDTLGGGVGDDTVDGGMGDDTMDGGAGDDTLIGGDGDDTYVVEDGDTVTEEGGEGVDTVETSGDYALGDNLENLDLTEPGAAPQGRLAAAAPEARTIGRGNGLDNRIEGNSVANGLYGGKGDDRLYGEGGDDRLGGGEGRDRLDGGFGDDLLIGGSGRDALTGGGGADVFRFAKLGDGGDLVRDFSLADGDVVNLSRIDANENRAGDQAARFVDAFTGAAGQAVLDFDGERTVLRLDVDGDAQADFRLTFLGEVTADDAGWVL